MSVLARLLGDEEIDADFFLDVITGQVAGQYVDYVPLEETIPGLRDL